MRVIRRRVNDESQTMQQKAFAICFKVAPPLRGSCSQREQGADMQNRSTGQREASRLRGTLHVINYVLGV
jgi:hypothetical protein